MCCIDCLSGRCITHPHTANGMAVYICHDARAIIIKEAELPYSNSKEASDVMVRPGGIVKLKEFPKSPLPTNIPPVIPRSAKVWSTD